MNCPYCQSDSKVIETRSQNGGSTLRRRRKCIGPQGHRFTTYEGLEKAAAPAPAQVSGPVRRRMPRERKSVTHKFSIGGHEGYITAGKYEDETLGEIFISDLGKEGSTLRGMMNAFATAFSVGLQYGVPLEVLVRKFTNMRFDPEGQTDNPEIPFAMSMPDYIMRWLASRFVDDSALLEELGILTGEVRARQVAEVGRTSDADASGQIDPAKLRGPACPQCGADLQASGGAFACPSCGYSNRSDPSLPGRRRPESERRSS